MGQWKAPATQPEATQRRHVRSQQTCASRSSAHACAQPELAMASTDTTDGWDRLLFPPQFGDLCVLSVQWMYTIHIASLSPFLSLCGTQFLSENYRGHNKVKVSHIEARRAFDLCLARRPVFLCLNWESALHSGCSLLLFRSFNLVNEEINATCCSLYVSCLG